MSIDTSMPGSPSDVFAVAEWFGKVETTMNTGARETRRLGSASWGALDGPAGDAYRDFLGDLNKATQELEDLAGDAEDKVRSYGQQLKWRQEDMADHRSTARSGGLTVVGEVIQRPPDAISPGDLPAGATPEESAEWQTKKTAYEAAKDKVELYNELLGEVRGTFDRLDTWVTDNLVDLEKKLSSPLTIAAIFGALSGLGLTIPQNRFEARARDLRSSAIRTAEALARRRSGNPAVRSGSRAPRQQSIDRASRPGTRAGNLLGQADDVAKIGKWLARGNAVTALVIGGWEIANGKSPSSVLVETGTSMLAGAAAAAIIAGAAVTLPAWGSAAIVVGVGAGAAALAGWGYEALVPQATREKIDEGLRDAWDATGGKAVDAIGDAWNSVFG